MDMDETQPREEKVTISRAALRLELLEMEVRLKEFFLGRISKVEDDIRLLQLVNTTRDAASAALALETERRRTELAAQNESKGLIATLKQTKAGLVSVVIAGGALVVATINALHTIFS